MIVSVIGAGKMGLPLACLFAENGARVYACDINADLVATINRGECPIDEPGVPELLSKHVAAGNLTATTDTEAAAGASDAVVIIVPALLTADNHADLAILESVTKQVAAAVTDDTLVCYETTLPVGTTRRVFHPLFGDKKVHIAFSPERVKSGLVLQRLTQTPKIVGGIDDVALDRAADFYGTFLGAPVVRVASIEEAEFVKLAGMVYRDVNIALTNELSRYADEVGIDFSALIESVNTNGEAHLLMPGIGVGGHCTPIYPHFVIRDASERGVALRLASEGRTVNDEQPDYVVQRLAEAMGGLEGEQVVILGLGFRPGIKEHVCSPAFPLRDALTARGAEVTIVDSLYGAEELAAHGFKPGAFEDADVLVLNTAHEEFMEVNLPSLAAGSLKAVVDGRNVWERERLVDLGLIYIGVGRGGR